MLISECDASMNAVSFDFIQLVVLLPLLVLPVQPDELPISRVNTSNGRTRRKHVVLTEIGNIQAASHDQDMAIVPTESHATTGDSIHMEIDRSCQVCVLSISKTSQQQHQYIF